MIAFSLPMPPSVNNLYPTIQTAEGPRRIKSKPYKAWLKEAGWSVPPAARGKIPGRFRASLIFDRMDVSKVDLDGRTKALFDLLTKMHVIVDDSLNEGFTVDWSSPFTAPVFPSIPMVKIAIESLSEAAQ